MKIEIELEEIEKFKKEISELEKENTEFKRKINELNEKYLIDKAISLAESYFTAIISKIFKDLGFDENGYIGQVSGLYDVKHKFGKDWIRKDEVVSEIGTRLGKNFKYAFLNLYIKEKERIENIKTYEDEIR